MSKYKLHPVTAIINTAKAMKDMIFPIVIIFVANGFNFTFDIKDERFFQDMIPVLILAIAVVFTFIHGILKWWTYRYWFEDGELRVQYGLFVKKKRFMPFERIQSLNYKEGIFHRIFGLVQVTVETAGSKDGKPEASLTAVTRVAADQVEQEMNKVKYGLEENIEETVIIPQGRMIHKMSAKDLIVLATTSGGIGVVIFGVLAALSQFVEFIPFEWIFDEFAYLIKYSVILVVSLIFMGVLAAWIISVGLTLLNYYDFTVTEENSRLIITRGLLEKKRITIPLNRVQAIKIVENPLRQPFGLATVQLESAGGGFDSGKDKKIVLFPIISKKEAMKPLAELFPQFDFEIERAVQSPKRARAFFYRLDFLWMIPVIAVPTYFFFPYGLLSAFIIIPVLIWGIWQHKTAGFWQSGLQLTIVYRYFSRVTFYVQKHRIQAMAQRQSFFQKRKDIVSLTVTVMSGMMGERATAYHMERQEIEQVMDWYEHKQKLPSE